MHHQLKCFPLCQVSTMFMTSNFKQNKGALKYMNIVNACFDSTLSQFEKEMGISGGRDLTSQAQGTQTTGQKMSNGDTE